MSHRPRWSLPLLVLLIGGCYGYARQPTPAPSPAREELGTVRVTLTDGAQLDLTNAAVQGDSIVGMTRKPPVHRAAVAVTRVASLESYGFRWLRSGGLAAGILLGAALLGMLLFVVSGGI